MKEIISTITSKGQITIPVEVRKHLGLSTGDRVVFVLDSNGAVQLKVPRYPTVASLRGAAGSLDRPLSWEETLDIAHEDHIREKRLSK